VINFASEEIKHEYLPRIATGEIQASYCLSEADAGSDVASMRCRAERDGDDYILNGSNIGSPTRASPRPTPSSPRPNTAGGSRGISCFLVEKGPGVEFPNTRR